MKWLLAEPCSHREAGSKIQKVALASEESATDRFTCLSSSQFDLLEMDRLERPLVNLPLLLDPSSYVPDTVDLTDDALARKYWLGCFEDALDGVRGWFREAQGGARAIVRRPPGATGKCAESGLGVLHLRLGLRGVIVVSQVEM